MVAPASITVYDTIYDTAGNAVSGVTVTCVLNSSQETTSGGLIGPRQQSTQTVAGRFAFTVVCNDLLSPSGSTYTISTPFRSYDIAPQSANGSSQQTTAANVIVNVPTALQTTPSLSGTYSGPADFAIRSLTVSGSGSYTPSSAAGTIQNEWQMPPPNGTDDTTAIQGVLDACHNSTLGMGTVKFQPAPVGAPYIFTSLTFYSGIRHVGAGPEATILLLKAGSNPTTAAPVQSQNFATLTGTNSTAGVHGFSFENMCIDGNKASNGSMTVSALMRIYGYGFKLGPDFRVRNSKTTGLYSEWSTSGATPGQDSMEAHIQAMKVHDNGNHGVWWLGPHDSDWSEGESYQNNSNAGTAYGIFVDSNANASGGGLKCANVHSWGITQSAAWYWNAPQCGGTSCVGEGGLLFQLIVNDVDCTWDGGILFGGVNLSPGIRLGDTKLIAGTKIDTHIVACNNGAIDFHNEGQSTVYASIYQTGGTPFIGTPDVHDLVFAHVNQQANQGLFQIPAGGPLGLSVGTALANYMSIRGAATGSQPLLIFAGTDTNVSGRVMVQGAASLYLGNVTTIWATLSSANLTLTGGLQRSRQTPTEAVLVSGVDATLGEIVSVTLTAARLVGAPLNLAIGQYLTYSLTQGGAGGFAVTWNPIFKKTWADTGNTTGKISAITFFYDGTNLIQVGAQAAYV